MGSALNRDGPIDLILAMSVNAQQKCHVVALSRNVMERLEMKGSRSERSERRLAFVKVEHW